MNVLVTGGAGFIGSHVSETLLKYGHNVCIYDNFNDYYLPKYKYENVKCIEKTAKENNKAITIIDADIRDSKLLEQCFKNNSFDAVIHLAACAGVRPSIENAPFYIDVNVNGTVKILECMKKFNVKKMLFASSSSVYGNNKKTPFCETDSVDNPISPYAATKKTGELICHTYHHLYELSIACLRFFTVYGPRQRPDLAIYKFTDIIYKNEQVPFYGDGSMGRDYTYIDDTVNGIILALDWVCKNNNKFDIFNLGESYTVSLNDMVFTLEKTIGKTALLNRLPVPPGDVKLTWADIKKSKEILGYNPKTTFDKGIEKFISWFKSERNFN